MIDENTLASHPVTASLDFFLFFVTKKRIIFPLFVALEKPSVVGKFPNGKNKRTSMSDYCVKISAKSDHHALQNLRSNTDAKFARIDNKIGVNPYDSNQKCGKRSVLGAKNRREWVRILQTTCCENVFK